MAGIAEALMPFQWGPGNSKVTASELERRRKIADALRAPEGYAPTGPWSAIGALAGEGVAAYRDKRTDADEEAAQDAIAQALAGGQYLDVMGNDVATPQQSAVAAALYQQEQQNNDPMRQLQMEKLRTEIDAANAPQPIKPPQVETRYNPTSGREEKVTWNGATGTWEPFGGEKAPSDPMVTVNTGDNSGAFGKKADELAATRLGDVVTAGQGAAQFAGDLKTLAALAPQINTGKTAEVLTALGPYAEAVGIDIANLGEMQAYQSIIDKLSPQMRPAGSGAASDFDARQFLSSLPSLGRTPEGNQIIVQTLAALQQHKMAAAEIAGLAFLPKEQGGISWQEAEKRIRELPDPYDGFNEYRKQADAANKPAKPTTEEEYDALPSGALFIDPDDGNTYRKP